VKDVQDTEIEGSSEVEVLTAKQGRMVEALLQGRGPDGLMRPEVIETVSSEIIRRNTSSVGSAESVESGVGMRLVLESNGLTSAHLANVLREGLACRKHVVIKGVTRKLPDYALRLKYLELAHRLRGDLQQQQVQSGSVTYEERIRRIMHTVDKPVDK